MTPKEKAKELYLRHRAIISEIQFLTGFVLMSQAKDLAKKSALIAVDEILNTIEQIFETFEERKYWQEVKQEIQKL